jgi:hypothetical protein
VLSNRKDPVAVDDITAYLSALGDTAGWLICALGTGGHTENGRYRHTGWSERGFRWPAGRDEIAAWAVKAGVTGDVYACPYPMKTRVRAKGNAAGRRLVHADVDHELDPQAVESIGGFSVLSGTPGHAHVYIPLGYAVTVAQHELLCRGLAAYLGGDHKVSDNDLLRLPGTINHKHPAPVRLMGPIPDALAWPPGLGAALAVDMAHAEWDGAATFCPPPRGGKPVDLECYRTVAEALEINTGDRSADTFRVVSAAFDAGLLLGHARWAVRQRKDLAQRLDELAGRRNPVDDIAVCWTKLAPALRPVPQRMLAVVPDPPEPPVAQPGVAQPGVAPGDARGPLDTALGVFRKWLYLDDPAPVIATAAAVVANRAQGVPVWLLIVGPSSCGKTEVLSALFGLEPIVPASTITEAALLSGTPSKQRGKAATGGLMRQVGEFGILVCKDFTSVLSQNSDTAKLAMGALREVYDGRWDRPIGADGARVLHWEGKCGFIAGVTPAYDRFASIVNTLGDRYLLLRVAPVNGDLQMDAALARGNRDAQMRAELTEALHGLIAAVGTGYTGALSDASAGRLKRLAGYASRARTAVERDHRTGRIEVLPEPEAPARVLLAMRQLLGGMQTIGADDATCWDVLGRISLDCPPRIRLPMTRTLVGEQDWLRTAELAETVGVSTKAAAWVLDDLALLGLADKKKKSAADNSPLMWRASDWLREYWPGAQK